MAEIAYVNGQFCPIAQATISIDDRGFLFGDAVYEVLRAKKDHAQKHSVLLFEQHLMRLEQSLAALQIPAVPSLTTLPDILDQGLAQSNFDQTLIYIHISRGAHPRNILYPENMTPTVVITFRNFDQTSLLALQTQGVALSTTTDIRSALSNVKTTNLLPNVLARNTAQKKNYYESLFLGPDQEIRECSSSSIFIIEGNTVITPPLSHILPGVYRDFVLHTLANQCNLRAQEQPLHLKQVFSAAEVFITSTVIEIMPVIKIENSLIGTGKPGLLTQKLSAAAKTYFSLP